MECEPAISKDLHAIRAAQRLAVLLRNDGDVATALFYGHQSVEAIQKLRGQLSARHPAFQHVQETLVAVIAFTARLAVQANVSIYGERMAEISLHGDPYKLVDSLATAFMDAASKDRNLTKAEVDKFLSKMELYIALIETLLLDYHKKGDVVSLADGMAAAQMAGRLCQAKIRRVREEQDREEQQRGKAGPGLHHLKKLLRRAHQEVRRAEAKVATVDTWRRVGERQRLVKPPQWAESEKQERQSIVEPLEEELKVLDDVLEYRSSGDVADGQRYFYERMRPVVATHLPLLINAKVLILNDYFSLMGIPRGEESDHRQETMYYRAGALASGVLELLGELLPDRQGPTDPLREWLRKALEGYDKLAKSVQRLRECTHGLRPLLFDSRVTPSPSYLKQPFHAIAIRLMICESSLSYAILTEVLEDVEAGMKTLSPLQPSDGQPAAGVPTQQTTQEFIQHCLVASCLHHLLWRVGWAALAASKQIELLKRMRNSPFRGHLPPWMTPREEYRSVLYAEARAGGLHALNNDALKESMRTLCRASKALSTASKQQGTGEGFNMVPEYRQEEDSVSVGRLHEAVFTRYIRVLEAQSERPLTHSQYETQRASHGPPNTTLPASATKSSGRQASRHTDGLPPDIVEELVESFATGEGTDEERRQEVDGLLDCVAGAAPDASSPYRRFRAAAMARYGRQSPFLPSGESPVMVLPLSYEDLVANNSTSGDKINWRKVFHINNTQAVAANGAQPAAGPPRPREESRPATALHEDDGDRDEGEEDRPSDSEPDPSSDEGWGEAALRRRLQRRQEGRRIQVPRREMDEHDFQDDALDRLCHKNPWLDKPDPALNQRRRKRRQRPHPQGRDRPSAEDQPPQRDNDDDEEMEWEDSEESSGSEPDPTKALDGLREHIKAPPPPAPKQKAAKAHVDESQLDNDNGGAFVDEERLYQEADAAAREVDRGQQGFVVEDEIMSSEEGSGDECKKKRLRREEEGRRHLDEADRQYDKLEELEARLARHKRKGKGNRRHKAVGDKRRKRLKKAQKEGDE
ncbi:unnamed protein product [Vitrella brassicaformis CCMP3155]|uniref:Uncharacterized protein n=1 Tax=Vitrella brassicaformis (strain CCMP3155) TaxID=1169540 RepID=A0A0G4EJ52_VITBC|nr:unnamed protein product [Vitrella brassicaformis CCMP3155]|eukprot:CEL96733.1 unnamed protein product [Vitrella brassicaformis CCMP3155]